MSKKTIINYVKESLSLITDILPKVINDIDLYKAENLLQCWNKWCWKNISPNPAGLKIRIIVDLKLFFFINLKRRPRIYWIISTNVANFHKEWYISFPISYANERMNQKINKEYFRLTGITCQMHWPRVDVSRNKRSRQQGWARKKI